MYKKASFLASCQAPEEKTAVGEVDQRFAGGGQTHVVFAHAPVPTDPSQWAFDDPPPGYRFHSGGQYHALELPVGRDLEATPWRAFHACDGPAELGA